MDKTQNIATSPLFYSNAYDLHQDHVNDHRQNIMVGLIKICRVVTFISMIMTLTVAAASVVGIVITGFYPGIIVLLLLTLIPIASYFYNKNMLAKTILYREIISLQSLLLIYWLSL